MITERDGRGLRNARIMGRVVLGLSILVLLAFGVLRIMDMTGSPAPTDDFGIRYARHRWVALIHIVPGLLYIALVPLQFVSHIRERRIGFHRWLGRVLVVCAAVSGIFALAAAFILPAFAGITTQSATVFFGAIYLISLAKAYSHIRHKRERLHHQWMIRVVAIAMGVASIRLYILVFTAGFGMGFEEVFGASFWLGLGTNLLIAEVWISRGSEHIIR